MVLSNIRQIVKQIVLVLRIKKYLIISLILLMALYLIYTSSDSWLTNKSVSKQQNYMISTNRENYLKSIVHNSLPNLIQRQLIIDPSNGFTITPEKLSSFINHSNSSILKKTSEMFAQTETQKQRQQILQNYCTKYGFKHRIVTIWRKSSNNYKGKHRYCTTKNCPVLVDEKHKFMFCFIQKIASTSMKKFFALLSDSQLNYSSDKNITAFHFNANDVLPRISPMYYNTKQNKHYFKAIFVRHPFLRLISAFKDKGEKNRSEEPYFYSKYWDPIMKTERGESNVNNNSRPLFKEFVQLLLNSKLSEYDEHWAPIWNRCEPCYVEYDFIGKLETPQDFDLMQNRIKPKFKTNETIWENKNWNNFNNREAKRYLLQISSQQIIDLYKIYFLDFKLFGYTIEEIFK